jgi:glycerol kinase
MAGADVRSAAIDLGSTRIKAGLLDSNGVLVESFGVDAPALSGSGLIREGNPEDYLAAVSAVLERLASLAPTGTPLGLTSQRSTFLLWDTASGRPRTPMISWQDRRAADWCRRHAMLRDDVRSRTGLLLSPHYVGPKLASLRESSEALRAAMDAGDLRFGTLDAYLVRERTGGAVHTIDGTMAARTLMFDIRRGVWSAHLLRAYDVPEPMLPRVVPTSGRQIDLGAGWALTASIADQAAGALAVLDADADTALVTLGTGGFVLLPERSTRRHKPGYLVAPILTGDRGVERSVLEGTINGAGAALDRFPGPEVTFAEGPDPAPDAFCLPDVSGLGSPHWRPEIGLVLNDVAERLDPAGRRRVVLEGLLFRVRELLDDLCSPRLPERILLSGGVTREPALAPALASLLDHPVEQLDDFEAGLIGTARLAANLAPFADPPTTRVDPTPHAAYLRTKYSGWRTWLRSVLARS